MIYLYRIDNRKFTATLPNGFFNLVDADPPYFSGPEKRKFYGNEISKINIKTKEYPITETWELPTREWFEEIKRVSKNQIVWGANYFDFIGEPFKTPRIKELDQFLKDHPTGWIVWDKCNGNSSYNDYELAWTSFKRPTVVYKFMWNGMMQGKSVMQGHIQQGNKKLNQKKIHQTEKPILLYEWQFKQYTKPGDKVLSTHGGSFSDAIAALKFNIDFYGCELSKIHFKNAYNRFKKHQSQLNLFFNHNPVAAI